MQARPFATVSATYDCREENLSSLTSKLKPVDPFRRIRYRLDRAKLVSEARCRVLQKDRDCSGDPVGITDGRKAVETSV